MLIIFELFFLQVYNCLREILENGGEILMKIDWEMTKRYNSKTEIVLGCAGFIFCFIIIIYFGLSAIFGWATPDWIGWALGYLAFGGVLIGGIIGYFNSKKKLKEAVGTDTKNIWGVISGFSSYTSGKDVGSGYSSRRYYPTYEFELDGEIMKMPSTVAETHRRGKVGDKVKLVYNYKTKEIFCLRDMKIHVRLFLVLAAVGLGAVVLLSNALFHFWW
jgi:hypothetical protein